MRTTHFLSGLIAATLFIPLSACAESDTDRAKREVDAFCKTVPLYCSKLSKAQKQAMFKRFKDESPHATPLHVPEPNRDSVTRDREGWPVPTTPAEARTISCAKGAGFNPFRPLTPEQIAVVALCAHGMQTLSPAR